MTFWSLAQTILVFVGIVVVGWALRRTGVVERSAAKSINNIIIYVGLPAMIFRNIHAARLERSLVVVGLVAWAVFVVSAVVAWAISRSMRLPRPVAGGFIIAAALGNTGYIGYPVAEAFLGAQGQTRAIFYDVLGTVAALLFVGLFIAERMGHADGKSVNPAREVLGFPAVLAVLVALALRPFAIPDAVGGWLDLLASLTVPLIMITVGLSLRPGSIRDYAAPLAALSGVKLLLGPVVGLGVGAVVFSDPEVVRLVVLQAGMPSMMLSLVIGARFRLDTDFIASAILVTTLACVISIPLMQLLAP